jgi:putative endonuclease
MPFWNITFGRRGERVAARFLRSLGYRILARNHRNRFGEIDLIAADGETLVFVEVKTRRSHTAGAPFEAVDRIKQRQLTRAALAYLGRHRLHDRSARFDVVGIVWPNDRRGEPEVRHYVNAFEAADP